MKKCLCALLALTLFLLPLAGAETSSAAGSQLGFELLRELNNGSDNRVLSPVSLAYALAMAAEGAEGDTRAELLKALAAEDPSTAGELTDALEAAGLKVANAAFATGNVAISEDYIKALAGAFEAEWFEAGDDLAGRINQWVSEHTDGLIDKMLDDEPCDDTALALVNALAMDADWLSPFAPDVTVDGAFHAPDGDVTVPFMHQTLSTRYGERDGVQLLRLGYADSDLELLIALPGEDGSVSDVLDGLCEEGLAYFQFGEEGVEVSLSMPKTDISDANSLVDALKALGIEAPFGDSADFSGISEEGGLYISQILQKARLTFDEAGTQAAAATVVAVATSAYNPDLPVEFNMDRPFVAVIADAESGAVCFAAVVNNPLG